MKGLLLKDYYMAVRYCRAYALIAAVFICVSGVGEGNAFMLIYPVVFCAMIPVTLIGYEERSRWTTYCETFPYSRAQIVSSKYILAVIIVAAVTLLTAAVQAVSLIGSGGLKLVSYMNMLSMLVMIGLAGPGILLPLIFKYGVEKGRIGYYIVIGAVCGIGAVLTMEEPAIMFSIGANWMPAVFILIGAAVFVLSWGLSIRFYESREL